MSFLSQEALVQWCFRTFCLVILKHLTKLFLLFPPQMGKISDKAVVALVWQRSIPKIIAGCERLWQHGLVHLSLVCLLMFASQTLGFGRSLTRWGSSCIFKVLILLWTQLHAWVRTKYLIRWYCIMGWNSGTISVSHTSLNQYAREVTSSGDCIQETMWKHVLQWWILVDIELLANLNNVCLFSLSCAIATAWTKHVLRSELLLPVYAISRCQFLMSQWVM